MLVTEPRQASEMPEAARQFMAGAGTGEPGTMGSPWGPWGVSGTRDLPISWGW